MRKLAILIMAGSFLAGCYRMPTDEDFSTVPTTNNPYITRDQSAPLPSVNY